MDYCDEAALQSDATPWMAPPLTSDVPPERAEAIRTTWLAFLAAGLPAPRALDAFVATLLPGARPGA
jgi:hypothetical protein